MIEVGVCIMTTEVVAQICVDWARRLIYALRMVSPSARLLRGLSNLELEHMYSLTNLCSCCPLVTERYGKDGLSDR